jgi:hypothetical protein
MDIKCKNCNTRSDYRRFPAGDFELNGVEVKIHKCVCGRLQQQTYWVKALRVDKQDGEIVYQHFYNPEENGKEELS